MPEAGVLGEGIVPLDELEFQMVQRAMRAEGGNQSKAARLLGVSRDQVRYRVKRYREEGRWDERWGGAETEE
jgi:transcriptional regulator with GAF, ATPase, and Fis domain